MAVAMLLLLCLMPAEGKLGKILIDAVHETSRNWAAGRKRQVSVIFFLSKVRQFSWPWCRRQELCGKKEQQWTVKPVFMGVPGLSAFFF